jgi:hypothetical protein
MEREGAPLSPHYVPTLDIVLSAEARLQVWLESSQEGMNIVTVLDERGNALRLFRATPALLKPCVPELQLYRQLSFPFDSRLLRLVDGNCFPGAEPQEFFGNLLDLPLE